MSATGEKLLTGSSPAGGREIAAGRELCLKVSTGPSGKLHRAGTRLGAEKATELVEAAVVVPLLVMLLVGIIWFARAYNTAQTLTRAAREGARFAVAPTCATCGNLYPTEAEVRARIDTALVASATDPASVQNFSMLRQQVLNPDSSYVERGVVITFQYPFRLLLPFTPVAVRDIMLNVRVQRREE